MEIVNVLFLFWLFLPFFVVVFLIATFCKWEVLMVPDPFPWRVARYFIIRRSNVKPNSPERR
jgi:hypothetical protein